jgi:hypothetical protein
MVEMQRASRDKLVHYAELLASEEPELVEDLRDQLYAICPPASLAVTWARLGLPDIKAAHERVACATVRIDAHAAVSRIASALKPGIEKLITSGNDPYRRMAEWILPRACERMRFELQRLAGPDGHLLDFGGFSKLSAFFTSVHGEGSVHIVLVQHIEAALRVFGLCFLRQLDPVARGERGLEYLLALRDEPDWFWCSEILLAAQRDDVPWLEQLTTAPQFLEVGIPLIQVTPIDCGLALRRVGWTMRS